MENINNQEGGTLQKNSGENGVISRQGILQLKTDDIQAEVAASAIMKEGKDSLLVAGFNLLIGGRGSRESDR